MSPAFQAAFVARAISTFSCDIACEVSPVRSRRERLAPTAGGLRRLPATCRRCATRRTSRPPLACVPVPVLDWHLALRAMAGSTYPCDRQVPEIAHFENFDGVVGEGIEPGLPPATHSVVAVQAALYRHEARKGLYVIVHQGQQSTDVASVQGVKGSEMQLDVLLRHRSRSIPPGEGRGNWSFDSPTAACEKDGR